MVSIILDGKDVNEIVLQLSWSDLSPLLYTAVTENLHQALGAFLHKQDLTIINESGQAIPEQHALKRCDVIPSRPGEECGLISLIKSLTFALQKLGPVREELTLDPRISGMVLSVESLLRAMEKITLSISATSVFKVAKGSCQFVFACINQLWRDIIRCARF